MFYFFYVVYFIFGELNHFGILHVDGNTVTLEDTKSARRLS